MISRRPPGHGSSGSRTSSSTWAPTCRFRSRDEKKERLRITQGQVDRLEELCDRANAGLEPLRSFVLPGGTDGAARLHLARTVCRRAERRAVGLAALDPVNPLAIAYLNRLSDLLFILARVANTGSAEPLWQPGG